MPELETFKLMRQYPKEATTGHFCDLQGNIIVATLEPPRRNNAKDDPNTPQNEAGCIPEGIYIVRKRDPKDYEKLEKKPRFLDNWEILNVPDKEGVIFHTGNYWFESKSCILVATSIIDMNPKNDPNFDENRRWYASQSIQALEKFYKILPKSLKRFKLIIASLETEKLCNV